ncbi:MAG: hypothetical protein K6T85_11455, partial [Gorillibacterium sp.]|nr:hypothetical protein [Gorillibacterium sp.]
RTQYEEAEIMSDLLRKAISLGVGLAVASKEKIEQLADEMVVKGELGKNDSKEFVKQMIAKGEEQRGQMKTMVQDQVRRVLEELDVATKRDVQKLEERLEARIEARFAAASVKDSGGEAASASSRSEAADAEGATEQPGAGAVTDTTG